MNQNHLARLQDDFRLGEVVSIIESAEGVLNKNYILETSEGKFFIKQVRDKTKHILPAIALVEELMSERGIPAVCMLASKNGDTFATYDGTAYSVYAFIESDRSHDYSLADYRRMGSLLGEIHKAGSKNIPTALMQLRLEHKKKESIVQELKGRKARIEALLNPEQVDRQFLEYINLKLELIPAVGVETRLSNDTLTHGDYHAGNLLIDEKSRRIVGVCDWEHAKMAPRAYELARSILYISFSENYEEEEGLRSAYELISGYAAVCPIDAEEVRQGLRARLHDTVCSIWLERHHYDLKDPRVDHFVTHEMRLIRDFVQGDVAGKMT